MALQMGKLIRQLRKKRGLTQKELGKGLISEAELSRVENGTRKPDILLLNALFHRLDASLEHFEIVVSGEEYEKLMKKTDKTGEAHVPLRTVVIAEAELLKDIRETRGWSQERMSENVCARETLSKLENGRSPKRKMWKRLLEKVDGPQEQYYGYVETTEYEVYLMVEEFQRLLQSNSAEASELLARIGKQLDWNSAVNRQFLDSSGSVMKLLLGQLGLEEELEAMEQYLRYTMPEYDGGLYRIPHRQEVVILQEIIRCQVLLGRIDAARHLEQMMIKKTGKKLKIS